MTGNNISLKVPEIIDHSFLENLVEIYSTMLHDWKGIPDFELPTAFELHFAEVEGGSGVAQDFDLVFIAYLAMIKGDFPTMDIQIYYPQPNLDINPSGLYFQLLQHKIHLHIICGKEIFRLFRGQKEETSRIVKQSESYIPPLYINQSTMGKLFSPPLKKGDLRKKLEDILSQLPAATLKRRKETFKGVKNAYKDSLGFVQYWKPSDLSGLYLLEVLSKLPISIADLLFPQVLGNSRSSVAERCQQAIISALEEQDIFNMSDMEIYALALLMYTPGMFDLPKSEQEIFQDFLPLFPPPSKLNKREQKIFVAESFFRNYENNMRNMIQQSKDIAFGLTELAKNIVEHATGHHGVITARIYNLERLRRLKRINPTWVGQFDKAYNFIDINVIDNGFKGICSSYYHNLAEELTYYTTDSLDPETNLILQTEYQHDMEEIAGYDLGNFFDFNSVKLFHQINRTKARLGLLIFSQTILSERKAFVKVASNDVDEKYPTGFALFLDKGLIRQEEMNDFYKLGTTYNFIIPISEKLHFKKEKEIQQLTESSMPSSVFLELQSYNTKSKLGPKLRKIEIQRDYSSFGKYQKLDELKSDLGSPKANEIFLLDATTLKGVLINSSDWVRFLANLQFTANGIPELIITNMPLDVYVEIINIISIFDRATKDNVGFWKQDRYVLFFIPIEHHNEQLEAPLDEKPFPNIFWFNSLLCGVRYQHFINANLEIDLYHNNLMKVTVPLEKKRIANPPSMRGPLFSSSGKLLNFELLIENSANLSLFEETTRSLLNIEIKDSLK